MYGKALSFAAGLFILFISKNANQILLINRYNGALPITALE